MEGFKDDTGEGKGGDLGMGRLDVAGQRGDHTWRCLEEGLGGHDGKRIGDEESNAVV